MLHVKIEYLWNKVLSTKVYGRDHLEDPGVDGRIILRLIFRNRGYGVWFMLHVKIEYLWNKVLSKKVYGRDHVEDPDVDGRIILSLIFRKRDVGRGLD
jgi:hypothetical protein